MPSPNTIWWLFPLACVSLGARYAGREVCKVVLNPSLLFASAGEMSIEDLLKNYSLVRTDEEETVEQSESSLISEQEASGKWLLEVTVLESVIVVRGDQLVRVVL